MVGGKLFRAVDSRCWDVLRRLADMEADGVDVQVLSPMPELLSHWFGTSDADDLARHVNGVIADMIAASPNRFEGIGMAPVQEPELAARRLGEIRAMGLCGIEIGTHIDGVPLGNARLDPIYAAAEELGLVILVHPLRPCGMDRIGGKPELAAVVAFPLETALAAASLLAAGVTERFPRLRILLSHGGGALPWILPRLDYAWSLGGDFRDLFARQPRIMARRFYYDTVLYDAPSLRFLADAVGGDRLVVGSDYPFVIRQQRPAVFAAEALGSGIDLHANAAALIAPPIDGGHKAETRWAAAVNSST